MRTSSLIAHVNVTRQRAITDFFFLFPTINFYDFEDNDEEKESSALIIWRRALNFSHRYLLKSRRP